MDRLTTPEHLHILVNHIPVIGLAVVCVFLIYGMVRFHGEIIGISLLMCVAIGALTYFVMWTGHEAEESFEHGALSHKLDAAGQEWLEGHEERAEVAAVAAYVTAALAAVSWIVLFIGIRAKWIGIWLTLASALVTVGLMGWAADAGGQIRHPEFRQAMENGPQVPGPKAPDIEAPDAEDADVEPAAEGPATVEAPADEADTAAEAESSTKSDN